MESPFDTVKGINMTNKVWKIGVRVTNIWINYPKGDNREELQMVIMDYKGDKIQFMILNEEMPIWSTIIMETGTYVIQNFKVVPNDLQFKLCDHPFKLIFTSDTVIYPMSLPEIPPAQFDFKPFADIMRGNIHHDRLFGTNSVTVSHSSRGSRLSIHNSLDIPKELLITNFDDPIDAIVRNTYPNLCSQYQNEQCLRSRAILASSNEVVDQINDYAVNLIPGEGRDYFSADTIDNDVESFDAIPIEFLWTLKTSGIPNHKITLKIGTPIMLLCTLSEYDGLIIGTRLIVTRLGQFVLMAKVISGTNIGFETLFPRIPMSPSKSPWPFKLKRKQFPIVISYAMTLKDSEGQSLDTVGLYLHSPVFSHGELYVAFLESKTKKDCRF